MSSWRLERRVSHRSGGKSRSKKMDSRLDPHDELQEPKKSKITKSGPLPTLPSQPDGRDERMPAPNARDINQDLSGDPRMAPAVSSTRMREERSQSIPAFNQTQQQRKMPQTMRDGGTRREQGSGFNLMGIVKKTTAALGYNDDSYQDPSSHFDDSSSYADRWGYEERPRVRQPDPREELYQLRQDLNEKMAIIASLQQALQVEKLASSKIKLSADKMQLAMDNKDLFVGVQQNDDVIVTRFRNLLGQITTWSKKFAVNPNADLARLNKQAQSELERIAPGCLTSHDAKDLWNSGKMVRMIIQGWVSLRITERFFRAVPGTAESASQAVDLWMGCSTSNNVTSLENILAQADRSKVGYRDLHDWRSLTVDLISRVDLGPQARQDKQDEINRMAKSMVDCVCIWAPSEAVPDIEGRLRALLLEASDFSQLLRRQRACWRILGPPENLASLATREHPSHDQMVSSQYVAFDPNTMKDYGDLEDDYDNEPRHMLNKTVEVFIAPGLFKRGNADGEQYEIETCIAMRQVLCFAH